MNIFEIDIGLINFAEYPTKNELSKLIMLISFTELSLKFIIPSIVTPSRNTLYIEYLVNIEINTEIAAPNKKIKELKPIVKEKSNFIFLESNTGEKNL